MNLTELLETRHLAEFSIESIINSFPINQPLLIELYGDGTVVNSADFYRLKEIFNEKKTVLCNCLKCKKAMSFNKRFVKYNLFVASNKDTFQWLIDNSGGNKSTLAQKLYVVFPTFSIELVCTLNNSHKFYVTFTLEPILLDDFDNGRELCLKIMENKADDEERALFHKYQNTLILRKIGQYPDIMDLKNLDLKKYNKVLGEHYLDLKAAISLYNKGYGIGAYSYLRRVLEYIVSTQKKQAETYSDFNVSVYDEKTFADKIRYLEEFGVVVFPEELQPIKSKLYALISKGIHELNEAECKEYFDEILLAIETILDNVLFERERKKKLEAMVKKIRNAPK